MVLHPLMLWTELVSDTEREEGWREEGLSEAQSGKEGVRWGEDTQQQQQQVCESSSQRRRRRRRKKEGRRRRRRNQSERNRVAAVGRDINTKRERRRHTQGRQGKNKDDAPSCPPSSAQHLPVCPPCREASPRRDAPLPSAPFSLSSSCLPADGVLHVHERCSTAEGCRGAGEAGEGWSGVPALCSLDMRK